MATLHGTTWSAPQVFTTSGSARSTVELFQTGRVGVSCADARRRARRMVGDTELDWDGTSWSASPAPVGPAGATGDTAVSCPGPAPAWPSTGRTVSIAHPGSGWSTAPGDRRRRTARRRVVPDDDLLHGRRRLRRRGPADRRDWSAPPKVVPTPIGYTGDGTSLSCPTDQFCMVLTGDGDYATYQGSDPAPASTLAAGHRRSRPT